MRTIQLTAEMIDDETAVIRGFDCQYMIHLPGVRLIGEWDKACQSMRASIASSHSRDKALEADEWKRQCWTWSGVLRRRSLERKGAVKQRTLFPETWHEAGVDMRKSLIREWHMHRRGEWVKWSTNNNLQRRARRSVRSDD